MPVRFTIARDVRRWRDQSDRSAMAAKASHTVYGMDESEIYAAGLAAPGDAVTSLKAGGPPITLPGTSVAAPFVTGAMALLWSEFPVATAAQLRFAVAQSSAQRRSSVVPPLLNAAMAYQFLLTANAR